MTVLRLPNLGAHNSLKSLLGAEVLNHGRMQAQPPISRIESTLSKDEVSMSEFAVALRATNLNSDSEVHASISGLELPGRGAAYPSAAHCIIKFLHSATSLN